MFNKYNLLLYFLSNPSFSKKIDEFIKKSSILSDNISY